MVLYNEVLFNPSMLWPTFDMFPKNLTALIFFVVVAFTGTGLEYPGCFSLLGLAIPDVCASDCQILFMLRTETSESTKTVLLVQSPVVSLKTELQVFITLKELLYFIWPICYVFVLNGFIVAGSLQVTDAACCLYSYVSNLINFIAVCGQVYYLCHKTKIVH